MTNEDTAIFKEAVALAQASYNSRAYGLLNGLLKLYPTNIELLMWLVFISPDLRESRDYLNRAIKLEPNNPAIPQAQKWLNDKIPPEPTVEPEPVVAVPDKAKEKRKGQSLFYSGLFILSALVLAGGIIALILTVFNVVTLDSVADAGIPVYPQAIKVNTSPVARVFIRRVLTEGTGVTLKELKNEFYRVKKNSKDAIFAYYQKEMAKKGWTSGNTDLNTFLNSISNFLEGRAFSNGSKGLLVQVSNEITEEERKEYNVQPDESILIVVYLDANLSTVKRYNP